MNSSIDKDLEISSDESDEEVSHKEVSDKEKIGLLLNN